MLRLITAPAGMDVNVQKLQRFVFDGFLKAWNLQPCDIESYARCERMKRDKGYVPEWYDTGNEYQEVLYDDSKAVVSFFGIGNTQSQGINPSVDVHLVIFGDQDRICKGIKRADEAFRNDVRSLLKVPKYGFRLLTQETGIDKVLAEYPGTRQNSGWAQFDMHPRFCFRNNMKLFYKP